MNEIVEIPITYLATGEIDTSRTSPVNLSIANALLEPVVSQFRLIWGLKGKDFDFWEFANWVFVGFYWTMLSNVGQFQPVNYAPTPLSPLPRLNTVDLSKVTTYDSRYNWFVNETLYQRYSNYLTNTLLPIMGYTSPGIAKLSDTNRLQPNIATIIRSYDCEIRNWKHPIDALAAVVTTVYVFTTGLFGMVIFFYEVYETHKV